MYIIRFIDLLNKIFLIDLEVYILYKLNLDPAIHLNYLICRIKNC